MAQFNYYLKSQKDDKETLISLRITHSGKSIFLSTGLKVKPSCWCNDKSSPYFQRVLRTKNTLNASETNTQLNNLMELARITEASFGKMDYSIYELKNKLITNLNKTQKELNPNFNEIDFFQFWDDNVLETSQKINPKTGKLISSNTTKCMRQTKAVLLRYEKHTRQKVDFSTIDINFYNNFSKYCSEIEQFRTNTFGKHIRNIKGTLNKALLRGIKVKTDFKLSEFRSTKERTTSIYLTEAEIDEFINLDLTEYPGLSKTRDFFVIGCYTGLRWSDFTNLNFADFSMSGVIRQKNTKTSKNVTIPIIPKILPILNKYKIGDNFVFPKSISNKMFNSQLKDIGEKIPCLDISVKYISNIGGKEKVETYRKWERISSHTCRRSFATNMYLRGIDIFLIRKITGHESDKSFYEYIKIDEIESANNFMTQYEKSSTSFQ